MASRGDEGFAARKADLSSVGVPAEHKVCARPVIAAAKRQRVVRKQKIELRPLRKAQPIRAVRIDRGVVHAADI